MNKSITFLMPSIGVKPVGGFKVVFEYANRLANDGFDVHIAYSASLYFKTLSLRKKFRRIIAYFYWLIIGYSGKKWFKLEPSIKHHFVFSLNERHVPKTDLYVATAVQTADYLKSYNLDINNKFYLIQDFENWGVSDKFVYDTYRFGLKNIVISKWLEKKVTDSGAKCTLIPNGFDFNYFTYNIPIEQKEQFKVSMLYHNDKRKGCKYGIEALKLVKSKYPQLKAMFFGTPKRPIDLPDWIEYFQMPDRDTHNRIYNECAINLAPSLQEGWGLTVGEAMMCGEAIVCTDTLGFQEMVVDGENGFIVPSHSAESLAEKLELLLSNNELRQKIAQKALDDIQKFRWENSYRKFKELL